MEPFLNLKLEILNPQLSYGFTDIMELHEETRIYQLRKKEAFYKLIKSRRDIRSGFKPIAISEDTLNQILSAAHHAPSVGFMQPWNFILITDHEKKKSVKKSFVEARAEEAELFEGQKRELYDSLKLEGIMEAPLNILVTCERNRTGKTGLGRSSQENMDIYSTVCAIQNMWLAARIGRHWDGMGQYHKPLPFKADIYATGNVEPVAYLCLGYVDNFSDKPKLEEVGWEERLNLEDLVF